MYCIDAQNNIRTVDPDYQAQPGENLYQDLPASVLQSLDAIQVQALFLAEAQEALVRSDVQVLRCYERGMPLPAAWVAYRQQLREIGSGAMPGPVPVHPDWP